MIDHITVQQQIFDTRDDDNTTKMSVLKILISAFFLCIGLFLIVILVAKTEEARNLILIAILAVAGVQIFNKTFPYKLFMF